YIQHGKRKSSAGPGNGCTGRAVLVPHDCDALRRAMHVFTEEELHVLPVQRQGALSKLTWCSLDTVSLIAGVGPDKDRAARLLKPINCYALVIADFSNRKSKAAGLRCPVGE